jgi:hypothetical protein
MSEIIAACDPFKILRSIVSLVPVLVIDLMAWRPWSDPRLSNEFVDSNIPTPLPIAPETQGKITGTIGRWAANKADVGVLAWFHPSNPPEVGYLIDAFVSHDGSPFFGFQRHGELCRMREHQDSPPGVMQRDGQRRRRCTIIPQGVAAC